MFAAFEYVMGIYGVSIMVTVVVWLVIVAIRWLSGERSRPAAVKNIKL